MTDSDIQEIYNAYDEIAYAKDKASEHQKAYSTIIKASSGSQSAKRLAAQFIPAFFKYFPDLHSEAVDGVFDLCEDDSGVIRQSAIKSLPSLCKDGPQHTIKIADVLCQLLQLDDQDLVVVQTALQTLLIESPREVLAVLFRQGVKGADLRERTLDFITNQVVASKETLFKDPEIEMFFLEEMQKAIGSVSNSELETFAKIIMQTKSYLTGKLDLTGLLGAYIAHITSEKPFDIEDAESVKRVLVVGKLSIPLFKRTISADPLLGFFASHILPLNSFKRLADNKKTPILRLYVDSIVTGHPSITVLKSAGEQLTQLLITTVPAEQGSTVPIDFAQVECLTCVLYHIAIKSPEVVENEDLAPRFRNLYMMSQTQISGVKQTLSAAQAKKPPSAEQDAIVKNLTRTMQIHSNIHTVVKEFMKPKNLRSSKLVLHPSWKPLPEPTKPDVPKAPKVTKPATPSKPPAGAAKTDTKPGAKPGSKPAPVQQQQQQVGQNKRKAEQDANAKPKKPKIVRRHGPSANGGSPGSSSPVAHGSKSKQSQAQQHQHQHQQQQQPHHHPQQSHQQQQQQQQQHHQQQHHHPQQTKQALQHSQQTSAPPQHGKRGSMSRGGQAGFPSSFDNKRGRDSNGKISFLKR